MAGPTTAVIVSEFPDEALRSRVKALLAQYTVEGDTDGFYLNPKLVSSLPEEPRPFGIEIQSPAAYSLEEYSTMENTFGFYPRAEIVLFAGCNDKVDHRLLAFLSLKLAETLSGIIDFAGVFNNPPQSGKSIIIENSHLGDAVFLRHWMESENFHMIK